MEWFERVKEEVFSGRVSDSDIQDREVFDYLWELYDSLLLILFWEFGREFAGKITLWKEYLEFSYGWRSLEKGRRLASISHLPKYSFKVFQDGTFSISIDNIYNKKATKFFSKNLREALKSKHLKTQLKLLLEEFPEAFLWINDAKGKRTYQLFELTIHSLIDELTAIEPSQKFALKGGDISLWFSTTDEETDVYSFISDIAHRFIQLTKPLFVAFYLPLVEIEPKRKIRNAAERRNWEKVKKELLNIEKRCQLCGVEKPLEVAHIIPYSQGGPDSLENLLVLCSNCHRKMVPTEPIGVRKIKGKYWLSYIEKESRSIVKEPLQFSNHTLKENDFWRWDE